MHFQLQPCAENKTVRCTRGAIYDVLVDLRPDSPAYRKWFGVELTADNHRLLYVPEGCAQGYQTLVDETEMCYQTSQFYAPEQARGVRYDDPAFHIAWPRPVTTISEADRAWPDYREPTTATSRASR
jgi:dTDP-4-dehydrorhamnose 3,5-epimerase